MKKFIAAVIAASILASSCLTFSSYGEDAMGVEVKTVPEAAGMTIGAKAAIVMEPVTGKLLFAQDETKRLPIASTTKIMTALIALEQPDIDAVFTVDSNAIMVEGSSMGLQKGDKASLRSLATGMLLASGNDAANAAAVRIAGSIPGFVEMMNERARTLGLVNTSFETPSGLDAENHYSTALDLALLTREALKNDEFAAICSQYKMRVSYGNPPYERWLTNHNKLLNYYDGTIGVKTGFTKKAGRCLVSAAEKDGIQLICVTLSCPNDWSVHESLYERLFPSLSVEDVSKLIPALEIPVTGGTKTSVQAVKTDIAQVPVPLEGADVQYSLTIEPFLYAPVLKGQYLGEARIFVDGGQIFRLTLTAAEDVPMLHEYKEQKSLINILKGIFGKE